jgi:hypothetical protein
MAETFPELPSAERLFVIAGLSCAAATAPVKIDGLCAQIIRRIGTLDHGVNYA